MIDGAWTVDDGLVLQVGLMGMAVTALLVHLLSLENKKGSASLKTKPKLQAGATVLFKSESTI